MKIKKEFYGKTLTKSDSILGKIVLKVDESCVERYATLVQMGFEYIFEKDRVQPEIKEEILREEPEIILNEPEMIGIVFTDEPQVEWMQPKKTRKKKKNANS